MQPKKHCAGNPKDRPVARVGITFGGLTLHVSIKLLLPILPNFTGFAIFVDTFSLSGIADILRTFFNLDGEVLGLVG